MSHGRHHASASSPPHTPALARAIPPVVTQLAALVDRTRVRTAACEALEAECAFLQAQVDAAQARVREEKAAQKRLRAEIAGFLRERGACRTRGECLESSAHTRRLRGGCVTVGVLAAVGTRDLSRMTPPGGDLSPHSGLRDNASGSPVDDDELSEASSSDLEDSPLVQKVKRNTEFSSHNAPAVPQPQCFSSASPI